MQCTPDLTPAECSQCLQSVLDILALRMRGSLGERVAGVRCNVRYEVYPFYVGQAMVGLDGSEASSPAPLPSSSPPPPPRAVLPPAASPPNKKGKQEAFL